MVRIFDALYGLGPKQFDVAEVLNQNTALLQLVAALPDPVLVLNGAGQILCANAAARAILPTCNEGQHMAQSIRAPAVLAAVEDTLRSGGSQKVEFQMRQPVLRHFEVLVSAISSTNAAEAAAVIVLKDLTREQQVEKTRSDFVANASHELRTPLASLSGFIETLQGAAKDDPKARASFLDLMLSQANRMKRLIDDLLSLSRIEMNEHLQPAARVDLSLVIGHVLDLLAIMAKKENVKIDCALPDHLMVRGDWDELVQVHLNLIENALKYGASGQRIVISSEVKGPYVELTVEDFGVGILAEHIPRLTERFYRINVQDSRSRGGTGLGLAIVKHILNRHNGRLAISSTQGVGSKFKVSLPLFDA